jgi:hypothetical protein
MFLNPALGAMVDQFAKEKHPEYEYAGFNFAPVAQRQLINHLKAAGYNVVVVPAAREKPNQLLKSYNALPTTGVDAYLDIAPTGVGFQGSYAPFAKKVGPHVSLFVRLVSARTKDILYQDYIHYGWGIAPAIAGTELDAPEAHVFKKTKVLEDDLMSADKQKSIAQLTHGIDVVMQTIVSAFSAYSVRGLPQQGGATPRADSPIEVSKAAPTTTPSPGGAVQKGTVYKIAIFPFDGDSFCVGRNRPSDEQFAVELGASIKRNNALVLAYSYYDQNLNHPPIKKPGRLWKGSKPNLAQVYALGESHGVDAVVMYWRADASPGLGGTNCITRSPPFPIDVWVMDIKQRKAYPRKGREEKLSAMTEQALSKFLANAQPKVVATAPRQRSEVRTTQTASAARPFEGITLPAGGSVEAINAAAEAYCGSLSKKSRLIAGPPNNPDYVFQCYQPTKPVSAPTPPPKTTVAKAAPEIQEGTPYKIAILQASGCFINDGSAGCGPLGETEAAQTLAARISRDPALVLAYSHYDKTRNKPSIGKAGRFWTGGATRKKPNLNAVYALAKERNWDGVLMYWGNGDFIGGNYPATHVPVQFYMIDATHRQVRIYKGMTDTVEKVADQALSKFVAGRR